MNKKRVAINMTAQLLAFAVNMLLGFILVPVIDSMIPNAYGFTDTPISLCRRLRSWCRL